MSTVDQRAWPRWLHAPQVRKLKLKQIAKLKRKKRRKRKAAEAKAAEEAKEKAEAEAKEMAEKLKEQTFIAGPDGENLYEVDPYVRGVVCWGGCTPPPSPP